MKLALDTNVLVRYLTWDDPRQAAEAAKAIEASDTVAISSIVLCELVWVLKRTHRYGDEEIADTIQRLVELNNVEVDRPAAEAGLATLHRGADFADGVILHEAERAKCQRIATFDQNFANLLPQGKAMLLGKRSVPRR